MWMTLCGGANRGVRGLVVVLSFVWAVVLFGGLKCYAAVEGQEFAGTTPCDARSREFLGGLGTNAGCHCVTWNLTLATKQNGGAGEYVLVTRYGLHGRNDPNQIEQGPTVTVKGKWELDRGRKGDPGATVYRLHGPEGKGS